jgi:hypothetical protein
VRSAAVLESGSAGFSGALKTFLNFLVGRFAR